MDCIALLPWQDCQLLQYEALTFGYYCSICNHAMFANSDTACGHNIGDNPAVVLNGNCCQRFILKINHNIRIGIIVIQSTHYNVLSEDNIVSNCNRANYYIANLSGYSFIRSGFCNICETHAGRLKLIIL